MSQGRILAIDYGARHIGVAVTDPDRIMAFGRGTILNKNLIQLCAELAELISREVVVKIVIGLPLGKNGEETVQTEKIRRFSDCLSNFLLSRGLQVEIDYIDESFSSHEAAGMLDQLGVPARKKKATEDELAAIVLLRRYMDFRP